MLVHRFHRSRVSRLAVAAALLLCTMVGTAVAEDPGFPSRPLRLIVGFPPGGITDIVARVVARGLGEKLGQPVIVENRPGATGKVAMVAAKQAASDGYTLAVINGGTHGVNPAVQTDLGYDPQVDFAPIAWMAETPTALVVHPSVPARSVKELVALIAARPGVINFASSGNGTGPHLSGLLFLSRASLPAGAAVHVPYRGDAPAVADLVAGQVQMMFVGAMKHHVDDGRLIALATTGRHRWSAMPNVPTMIELGFNDFYVAGWSGIAAPAGVSGSIVSRLNRATNAALREPDVVRALNDQGFEPRGGTPEDLAELVRSEIGRWKGVVRDHGLKFD